MAIVKRMMIGNTKITICDDCAVKTEAEKQEILNKISHRLGQALRAGIEWVDKPIEFEDKIVYCDEMWQPLPT